MLNASETWSFDVKREAFNGLGYQLAIKERKKCVPVCQANRSSSKSRSCRIFTASTTPSSGSSSLVEFSIVLGCRKAVARFQAKRVELTVVDNDDIDEDTEEGADKEERHSDQMEETSITVVIASL